MTTLAIDPGNERSAYVVLDGSRLLDRGIAANAAVLDLVGRRVGRWSAGARPNHLAIEMIASYGMPVGREVFDTCVWIGRFVQAWKGPHTYVYRREVKLHLCGHTRAKDGNVRAALINGRRSASPSRTATGQRAASQLDLEAVLVPEPARPPTRATRAERIP